MVLDGLDCLVRQTFSSSTNIQHSLDCGTEISSSNKASIKFEKIFLLQRRKLGLKGAAFSLGNSTKNHLEEFFQLAFKR